MRIINKVVLTVVMIVFLSHFVRSENINLGVSPSLIQAEHLLPGSHFEKKILISKSGTTTDLILEIEKDNEIGSWISYDKGNSFIFPKDQSSIPLTISIDVPSDTKLNNYESKVNVKLKNVNDNSGNINTEVVFPINIKLKVIDQEVDDYSIKLIRIPTIDQGSELEIILIIDNKGNVHAQPKKIIVEIMDKFKTETVQVVEHDNTKTVEPFTKDELVVMGIENDLSSEQYYALIKVYDEKNGNEVLVSEEGIHFDVLKYGKLGKATFWDWLSYIFIKNGDIYGEEY